MNPLLARKLFHLLTLIIFSFLLAPRYIYAQSDVNTLKLESFDPVTGTADIHPDLTNNGPALKIRNYHLSLNASNLPSSIDMPGHQPLSIQMVVPAEWKVNQVNVEMRCSRGPSFNYAVFDRNATLLPDKKNKNILVGRMGLLQGEKVGNNECTMAYFFMRNDTTVHTAAVATHLHDPYGIVTSITDGKPLEGVKVTLYVRENGQWVVWPAEKYDKQVNPQYTDVNGVYSFLTPSGEFYISGELQGYQKYEGPVLTVKELPVEQSFIMKPLAEKSNINRMIYIFVGWILIISLLALLYIRFAPRKKNRRR